MKEHSRRLGIEKMYPLFICIVTGRSWDAVTQGVDQTAVSKSEVTLIHLGYCFVAYLLQCFSIGAVVIVWRARGKIIMSVLCSIMCNNCIQ